MTLRELLKVQIVQTYQIRQSITNEKKLKNRRGSKHIINEENQDVKFGSYR